MGITVECTGEERDRNNVILGYYLRDSKGVTKYILKDKLKTQIKTKKLCVKNLTLTSDNRLVVKTSQSSDANRGKQVKSKPYRVAVTWEYSGYIEVEGTSLKDAMDKFREDPDSYELPYDGGEYVDGSFQLSTDDLEMMRLICGYGTQK